MLTMDVQQLFSDPSQLCHSHRAAVGTAEIFAIGKYLPLHQQIPVLIHCCTCG